MSYFLCMSVPKHLGDKLSLFFDKRIVPTDASNYPIGKTAEGAHGNLPYLLFLQKGICYVEHLFYIFIKIFDLFCI